MTKFIFLLKILWRKNNLKFFLIKLTNFLGFFAINTKVRLLISSFNNTQKNL